MTIRKDLLAFAPLLLAINAIFAESPMPIFPALWQQQPWNIGATSKDSVIAELNSDGTLAISGVGKMEDFDIDKPWDNNASAITKLIVGNGVASIGDKAFANFKNLTSVAISSSVTSIGELAFTDCRDLKAVTILNPTPPKIDDSVFSGVNKETCILYVPKGSESAYRSAEGWKEFKNIRVIETPPPPATPRVPPRVSAPL